MQALVTNYYETAAMILFSIGFTMLLLQKNLIKKAIGLNLMDMSVYLFLAAGVHSRWKGADCRWKDSRGRIHQSPSRRSGADGYRGVCQCVSLSLFTDTEIPPLLQDPGFGRHAV